jgi:L-alanine-DL-glutamate epimerase-like enolase superfamily enzyme
MCYPTRDYVVLKLTTDAGLVGWAIGYTRGTPLLESTKTLAGSLPSRVPTPADLQDRWRSQFAPGWSALVRAASLFDICLWDIFAKVQGRPLGNLLGERTSALPLMAVAGYFISDRGVDAVIDEAVRFANDGFSMIKVMLPGLDPRADERLVGKVRDALPPRCAMAVDLHGMFQTVEEAATYSAWLNSCGLSFIEDPFPSAQWREVAAFQTRSSVPVASGEDLVGLGGFLDLMEAGIPILRVDTTASGGFTTALRILDASSNGAVRIIPHVWPHFHVHLAAASAQVTLLEVIPDYVGADPMWALFSDGPNLRKGAWDTEGRPGTGLDINADSVAHYSTGHWHLALPKI